VFRHVEGWVSCYGSKVFTCAWKYASQIQVLNKIINALPFAFILGSDAGKGTPWACLGG